MKSLKLSLVVALLATTASFADDKKIAGLSVSGDATFTSNYIWRGATASGNAPTVQTTLGVEHENGVYAGIWGSGLSEGTEADLYAGYSTEVSGIGIDAGFCAYTYTVPTAAGTDKLVYDEYGEAYLGLSYDIGVELAATVYKGVLSEDKDSTVIEAGIDKDFGMAYVGAAYGYQLDEASGDNYWSATLGKEIKSVSGDLSVTIASTDADNSELVYALAYTTSF